MLEQEVTGTEIPAEGSTPQDEPTEEQLFANLAKLKEEAANEGEQEDEKNEEEPKEDEDEFDEEQYSKNVQKRIGKLTKDFRTAERERDEFKEKYFKLMQEKAETPKPEPKKEPETDKLGEEIDGLWVEYEDAMSELDGKKAASIQKKIMSLSRKQIQQMSAKTLTDGDIEKKIQKLEDERAVADFKKRNPWFEKDEDKTIFALGLERKLLQTHNGTYKEILDIVESRVNNFSNNRAKASMPQVSGVQSMGGATTSTDIIDLTDVEKEVARSYFNDMTPKQAYKEYMKLKQGAK